LAYGADAGLQGAFIAYQGIFVVGFAAGGAVACRIVFLAHLYFLKLYWKCCAKTLARQRQVYSRFEESRGKKNPRLVCILSCKT
jgi:hypothetical protein